MYWLLMYDLGASVTLHSEIHAVAASVLETLRQQTKESVQIAVLDGREVVYVDRLETPYGLRTFGRIGHRMPAHCTSTGKVLLAFQPDDVLRTLLDGWQLPRLTQHTTTDQGAFVAELRRVRERGFAENVSESEVGVASIAAPIRDARNQVVAALSLVAPIVRLDGKSMRRFQPNVTEAATAISIRLGWHPAVASASGAR